MKNLITTGATLSIQSKDGSFVEIGSLTDITEPKVIGFDEASEEPDKTVLIVGGSPNIRGELTLAFKEMGYTAIEAEKAIKAFNNAVDDLVVHPLKQLKDFNEPLLTNQIRDRDHGWYRQFEKPNKKRNLRR